MNEAKVPSDANDWEAIDIFLFSNGQEYSPPRKYHLRTEELTVWDATLSLLARCQYGSMHSAIHLYTLSGQKIEGPIELSNGGTYVAVTPPDAFIHAGYEKYLTKASKSWEKRQSRKSSVTEETPKPGEIVIQSDHSKSGVNREVINIITEDQNITIAARGTTKPEEQTIQVGKSQGTVVTDKNGQKYTTKRRSTPVEPLNTRTSILRKMNAASLKAPSTRKASAQRKNSTGKEKAKVVPQKIDHAGDVTVGNKKVTPKTPIIPTPNVVLSSSLERDIKAIKISTTVVPNQKDEGTESSQVDYIMDDKDVIIVSNLYKSTEDETMSGFVDANSIPTKTSRDREIIQPIIEGIYANNNYDTDNIKPDELPIIYNEILSLSNSEVKLTRNPSTHSLDVNKPESQAQENFVAMVSKGDLVNLKLNIEVRNGDGIVRTVHKNITHKSHSLTDVQEERIVSPDRTNREILAQSKSMESIRTSSSQKNPKVVVVRCGCDHYNHEETKKNVAKPHAPNNKTYFIIVPIVTQTHAEKYCCNCGAGVEGSRETRSIGVQSTDSLTGVKIIGTVMEDGRISRKTSITSRIGKNESALINQVTIASVVSDRTDYVLATQPPLNIEDKQKVECFVAIKNESNPCCKKTLQDSCSQTEWCSILLEVRKHEDGHYTFHLPTLQMLKSYYTRT